MFHNLNRSGFTICLCGVVLLICLLVKLVEAELTEDLIPALYLKYKDALNEGESNISIRRLFNNNKQYEIHVKRLKEVNGFKIHNLMVKEAMRSNENPMIYINNPVESKTPYAYLSLEEFKNALMNRIQAQKDELAAKRQRVLKRNNVTEPYVPLKTMVKKLFTKKITPRLFKTDINKVDRNTFNTQSTQHTKNTVKVKAIKESTRNLFVDKEFKPIVTQHTTKHEFSKQDIVENKIRNTVVNKTQSQTLKDVSVTLESTKVLIEREVNSLMTTKLIEHYTEINNALNVTANQSLNVTLEDASEFIKSELDLTMPSTLLPVNVTEAMEKAPDTENEEIKTNETKAFSTYTKYSDTYDSLTTLVNVTSSSIYNEIPSTTTEIVTLQTKEVKKETPKRSTVSKKDKEKKRLATKTAKRKRSTLGRPLVFME